MRSFVHSTCLSSLLVASLAVSMPASTFAQSSSRDAASRAQALVGRMTLDEKISQLHGISDADHFRYVPGIPRLGIPPLRITNGPAGVGPGGASPQPRATALPAPIALAASWDVDLARRYGRLAGLETGELGSDLLESPGIQPGTYDVVAGSSSRDLPLKASITMK